MKIAIINGPNLNKLGTRDSAKYGTFTLIELNQYITKSFPEIEFSFYQSNLEGELINFIQLADEFCDGLIINPGGFSHTSVAIKDALELVKIPKIEVHLSNIASRENFRNFSLTASATNGYLSGFKELSYIGAIFLIIKMNK